MTARLHKNRLVLQIAHPPHGGARPYAPTGVVTARLGARIVGVPALWLAALAACMLMFLAARPAAAQSPVTLNANVDRTTVTVGDKIRVTLTLTMPADGRIDLPALEQQFGDLEILFVALPVQQPSGGQMQVQLGYDVAAYTVGATRLPPITAEVQLADGSVAGATSNEIAINVVSVIPAGENPTDVRDLKPPIALPEPEASPARMIAAAVIAALLVAAVAFLIVRRMRRPATAAPVPIPISASPEARARAELERIAGLKLVEQGDYKQLHTLLAACIRRYLTERYRFPARAMTTSELRRLMDSYGVDRWQGRLTIGLLSESDAIIFAGYEPARTRVEANFEMAYQIVDAGDHESEPQPQAVGS